MSFRRENRTFVEQIDVSPEVFSRPVITVELQPMRLGTRGTRQRFSSL